MNITFLENDIVKLKSLKPGDCFTLFSSKDFFIKTDKNNYVCLETGTVNYFDEDTLVLPVEINAKANYKI